MSILAGAILIAMLLFIVIGAVQMAFWLIIAVIIYLCICSIWEKLTSWLKKYDS